MSPRERLADSLLTDLTSGDLPLAYFVAGEPADFIAPQIVFPGAFNPLHAGHRQIATLAAERLQSDVTFEISVHNVDKPDLSVLDLHSRLVQFSQAQVIFSRAPTFLEKSRLFPHATFLVGADTILRVGDVKYYAGESRAMQASIDEIAARGCRFLVFGRLVDGEFRSIAELSLPVELARICSGLSETHFRCDVASSEIRAARANSSHRDKRRD